MRTSGALGLSGSSLGINFSTEHSALALRVLQLLKNRYRLRTEVLITRSQRLKKNNRYQVRVLPGPQVSLAMAELQLLSVDGDCKNHPLLAGYCCKRAFLRGVFLGSGSISRPAGDYHLEMVIASEAFGRGVIRIMQAFSLKAKLTDRKNVYLVYLKDGESIIKFLNVIGAHQAMLAFENARILKEMRNNVNRAVNCETANLNKIIRAAVRQVNCIQYLDGRGVLGRLPQILQDTARLRLAYPEASLNELADYAGGVGKSGINHRLRKLQDMAVSLGLEMENEHL